MRNLKEITYVTNSIKNIFVVINYYVIIFVFLSFQEKCLQRWTPLPSLPQQINTIMLCIPCQSVQQIAQKERFYFISWYASILNSNICLSLLGWRIIWKEILDLKSNK